MLRIQILGIGCKKSRALKANVMEALDHIPLNVWVEEIAAIDDIMQYQIHSTPALIIDDTIVIEGEVPSVDDLEHLLEHYQNQTPTLRNMLVPTDFSPTAANAFRFATAMAKGKSCEVTLLHVYHPHYDSANPYPMVLSDDLHAQKQWQVDRFAEENYLANGNGTNKISVKIDLSLGFAADEIIRYSQENDLIVIGTTGDGNWLEHIFGSVSSQVARYAQCPVLLVPPGVTYKGFHTIVYASDSEVVDNSKLRRLVDWLDIPQAEVHAVHVEKSYSEEYRMKRTEPQLASMVQPSNLNLTLTEVAATDTLKALNTYANERNADLLVMSTAKRSLLENFFHRSLTKQMVLKAQMPILILHGKNDKRQ
ncbi:MAG: MTH895/ArsE family thioredoxin-like protein [Saprospiraceae bacterium]